MIEPQHPPNYQSLKSYEDIRYFARIVMDGMKIVVGEDQYVFVGSMNHVEDLKESLERLEVVGRLANYVPPTWQPIETIPKDGTLVIVYRENFDGSYIPKVGTDSFINGVWRRSRQDCQPTKWMHLPEAPYGKK